MTRYGSKELAQSFRTVRKNTIQAATDIPEEEYGLKPAPESRSVAELLTHIAVVYRFQHQVHAVEKLEDLAGFEFHSLFEALGAEEAVKRSKAEIIQMLETEGEIWASFLDGVSDDFLCETVTFPAQFEQPPKTRFEMLISVKEHEMHHRGQLMMMQRLLGIVPHLTRQRAERAAAQS